MPPPSSAPTEGSALFGALLTAVLAAAFFSFVALAAFAPATLAKPIAAGGTVTWAFACGLGVIALGVALTGLYVLIANGAEARRTGG
jgi:uncharacterized membrane protein (DUF485 family)